MSFENQRILSRSIYTYCLIALLGLALYLFFRLVEPFIHTFLVSMMLAVIFSPVFGWLLKACKGRRNTAAALTVTVIVFVILLPTVFVLFALVEQGVDSLSAINAWLINTDFDKLATSLKIDAYLNWIEVKLPFVHFHDIDIQARIMEFSRTFAQTMIGIGSNVVRNASEFILKFLLMIFILFYFMRDGIQMVNYLKYLSPLREAQEDSIIDSFKRVSRGVLMGCLLVAVLQGIVGGIGLAFVGIPGIFWGAMMAFAALIPVFGTGIIWVPAVGYLIINGDWKSALFLAAWCGVIVVGIDTFLRPYFMKEAARVSTFYIFMAIVGGVYTFGMLGILYGPLILSFGMVMLQIYGEEYVDALVVKDSEG
ncbi:AI-2E family transporter [Pseudodesulfovibrio senegalensis]|uniref:AI-2E family transporter n=1 Tax=Pseudodesulfovibrio senegalensis TaxID=1721087 RepID=A0A6N6N8D3_9BACT|nr:AI-2E family transporter [Pseudodesulfovibrio senegalensis]KAB1443539.1 AI-2E family transporter [Pseudodesulfovibrio senegalensis]